MLIDEVAVIFLNPFRVVKDGQSLIEIPPIAMVNPSNPFIFMSE
jgi:hypothetical protein